MKLNIRVLLLMSFTVFLFTKNTILKAQCAFSGLSPTYCISSPSSNLLASINGGTFSGQGIVNSIFDPALSGVGVHSISLNKCDSTYSLSAGTFSPDYSTISNITLSDNDMSVALPIGFTFRFFCNDYTSFYLSSNGFITFSPSQPNGCCQGLAIPTNTVPANMIAFAWTDLDPAFGGTLRYLTNGTEPYRKLIVSFNCIFHSGGSAPVTAQVILYETTNIIEIHTTVKSVATSSFNATMGIQNLNGSVAYVVPGRNAVSTWTASNEMYRFTPGLDCSITQTTQVFANPIVNASSTKSIICKGEKLLIIANGASNYTWSTSQVSSIITVTPATTTIYSVVGTNDIGCQNTRTVEIKVAACTGINEKDDTKYLPFTVFPNPSNDHFSIQSHSEQKLVLYNQIGVAVKTIHLFDGNDFKVEINNLFSGVYFLFSERNNNFCQLKVVIHE